MSIKRLIVFLLLPCVLSLSTARATQSIDAQMESDDQWWSSGGTAQQDGAFTAVSASMIGWGVGGVVAIIVAAALFGSTSSATNHSH